MCPAGKVGVLFPNIHNTRPSVSVFVFQICQARQMSPVDFRVFTFCYTKKIDGSSLHMSLCLAGEGKHWNLGFQVLF
jgi:hypothetical protein